MNVLFVTYDFPFPTTSGGKNRAYHLLKYTAKKANVFLFSFVREDYNPELNEELLGIGVKDIKVFKRRKLKSISTAQKAVLSKNSVFKALYYDKDALEEIKTIITEHSIDIVHYESSYTGYYIESLRRKNIKQILGTENIEFKLYEEYASRAKNILLRPLVSIQAKRLKNEELGMMKHADAVTVITQDEETTIKEITGISSKLLPNGIEPESYSYSFGSTLKHNILFVGNFTYFPNVDAINFFYDQIFRRLRKDITITIIGKKSEEKFPIQDERIIKKDFVEDIISEYRNSDLLFFPIRIGGGTNFKVLEAMSLGVPIVAQPERLAGLGAVDGAHFLKAETGEEYAEKINLLYENEQMRKKISQNARKLVEENFDWKEIGAKLLTIWQKAL